MNTTFEDRLLTELQQEIRLRAAEEQTGRAPVRRLVTARRVGFGLAACGAAATVAVVLPGSAGSSAYAVESHPDGRVTLTIDDLMNTAEEQQDLVRDLQAAGIKTKVDNPPAGKVCAQPRGHEVAEEVGEIDATMTPDDDPFPPGKPSKGHPKPLAPKDPDAAMTPGDDLFAPGKPSKGHPKPPAPKNLPEGKLTEGKLIVPGSANDPVATTIRRGDTVVIENAVVPLNGKGKHESVSYRFYRGEVGACKPIRAGHVDPLR
ncbi:hypothetical protein ACZ90_26970 [Streptomyces albus subsp. albus]|nr:hypothetical protein ACZ90_26970 [Streptomyces albus subsp. albus]